jgi:methyl-accepting chemotaxis protein
VDGAAIKMARAAGNVSESIESIVDVSEQNSTISEAVRAATEHMSAQAHEMVSLATGPIPMPQRLGELVGSFRLDGVTAVEAPDRASELATPSSRPHLAAA